MAPVYILAAKISPKTVNFGSENRQTSKVLGFLGNRKFGVELARDFWGKFPKAGMVAC